MKLYLVSLGCVRNLVDSEEMLGRLSNAGWTITNDPENADVIVINTCSFIESAVDESVDTILELARIKQKGKCRRLIVAGCLPERFGEEIVPTLPEVDIFLGTGAYDKILEAVEGTENISTCLLPDPNLTVFKEQVEPRVLSTTHMAYLKIAEGCSKHCTYCIIPKLRGNYRSRPLEDIVYEAQTLVSTGVQELILVSQDTTVYGKDLKHSAGLARLLEQLANISNRVWIRFLYGHPESIDVSVMKTVAAHPNICSYFDIPIQHASNNVLQRMGRKYTQSDLYRLFDKIRSLVPDAALRTTAIVGFPGETEQDFKSLMRFVTDIQFDHLGVFTYSDSEDLPSHRLSDHVPEHAAIERHDYLMGCQKELSSHKNRKHLGNIYDVLVEESPEENLYTGRTFFQAPEVDGVTLIQSKQMEIGMFSKVRITDTLDYDLIGKNI